LNSSSSKSLHQEYNLSATLFNPRKTLDNFNMNYMKKNCLIGLFFIGFSFVFSTCDLHAQGCFPQDKLPPHITSLTNFGQRAEWSLDGKQVYFLDKAGGEVWVVDVKTKKTRQITKPEDRPPGHGCYRVVCLANGDLLLGCGAERHKLYFQVLDKSLQYPPKMIEGEAFDEGPAVSRKSMKIAWTLPGQQQIYAGEIAYSDGQPKIIHKKLVVDNKNVVTIDGQKYEDILESQNWRPKNEEELIFAQYRKGDVFSSEVLGIDLNTSKIVNYSKAPDTYEEPEGIFPNGEYTLMESDKHQPKGTSTIEVYKLKLDGTGNDYERLTFFSDVKGFRASNPVVSDDGNFIAFQASEANSDAGAGCSLYLFDIKKFEMANQANKIEKGK
jgi:Tol biopolymer transport system component